jgi:predicted enzyme related to lactoylglutathione lyase
MRTTINPPGLSGLKAVVYHAADLKRAKTWYSTVLGIQPHIDQPFFVGFSISGFELGLDPDAAEAPGGNAGAVAYWGVADVAAAVAWLVSHGATNRSGVLEFLGGSVKLATVLDPFGNIFGVMESRP